MTLKDNKVQALSDSKALHHRKKAQKNYKSPKWITVLISILCVLIVLIAAYLIFVFVIPPKIETYYLDEKGVYQLDNNGSRVPVESIPDGFPDEFYFDYQNEKRS